MYLARWAEIGTLPRAGGVMDQDPYELEIVNIGRQVLAERQKQEEDRRK